MYSHFNNERLTLVPHGLQKKGRSERGMKILKLAKYALGEADIQYFLHHSDDIPPEWAGKIAIFWGTVFSNQTAIELSSTKTIPTREAWVKGIFLSGGLWKVESFPVDDDFSQNRLSAEIVPFQWWRRVFYILTRIYI